MSASNRILYLACLDFPFCADIASSFCDVLSFLSFFSSSFSSCNSPWKNLEFYAYFAYVRGDRSRMKRTCFISFLSSVAFQFLQNVYMYISFAIKGDSYKIRWCMGQEFFLFPIAMKRLRYFCEYRFPR